MVINAPDFEAERPRLVALATRILSSAADADDVVQEAWLRFVRADEPDDLAAWLTTVVTRLCLDHLRRGRTRSAAETVVPDAPVPVDPEADVLLAEKASAAMEIVVDALAPAERAAFVLHDVFGYRFDEISVIMGRSDTAVRKLASRARAKVQVAPAPFLPRTDRNESERVVTAFLRAARGGDLGGLLSVLAPDAIMRADLVGQQMGTNAVYDGAPAIAARFEGTRGAVAATIDGDLGAAWIHAGVVKVAFVFHVESNLVREVELIADPDVLATMEIVRTRADPDQDES
ncbi:MAG: sigma-70 family RNA polymerase sigma factor [Acidimicrobiia bacterium]